MRAIQHAVRINSWMENLGSDETPPEWMWPFEDRLTDWFKGVEEARKEKYGGSGGGDDSDNPMTSNEWVAED